MLNFKIIHTMFKNSFFLFAFILLWQVPLFASSPVKYQIKSHDFQIEGTSNLQSWTADVEQVNGTFSLTVDNGKITDLQDVTLQINANSIKGSEGRRMDSKIYEALDTSSNPNITFVLRDVTSLAENPGAHRVSSRGVLTVAGVSRVVTLNTVGRVLPNGDLEFSGTQKIKMSDYRVSPPTALLGALRTGDEVTLNYKVVLQSN
jgi:polyisoprenoid-binding protein YceI